MEDELIQKVRAHAERTLLDNGSKLGLLAMSL